MENELRSDRAICDKNRQLQHQKIYLNPTPPPREGGRVMSLLAQLPKNVYGQFSLIEKCGSYVPIRTGGRPRINSEIISRLYKAVNSSSFKSSGGVNYDQHVNLQYI